MAFQRVPGVVSTEVGYTQGSKIKPTYEQVCGGSTGHTEAVKVTYDTGAVGYSDLLAVYWDILDPTTKNRQGGDSGTQYRSGIYYTTESQRTAALQSKDEQQKKYTKPIVVEILQAKEWYTAEEYHQQYLQKGGQCAAKGDLTPIRCYG
jgi:peptide-methionine (S)-S-oxide reductase